MFVEAHCALPMPLPRARSAMREAIEDGGLVAESRRAYGEGLAFLMRVGPRAALSKEVHVRLLPLRDLDRTVVLPLRWEATGPAGRLFPAMDANVCLSPAGANGALLSILGRYQPPLGPFGSQLDRALLSRVATTTAEALLREIQDRLQAPRGERGGSAEEPD